MAAKSRNPQRVQHLLSKNRYNRVELTAAMMKADSSTSQILMDQISKEVKREASRKRRMNIMVGAGSAASIAALGTYIAVDSK